MPADASRSLAPRHALPLQLEHVVGAVRLLVGGTHGWPGHAADQRALARGLQREQEVYPEPCMRRAGFCASAAPPTGMVIRARDQFRGLMGLYHERGAAIGEPNLF